MPAAGRPASLVADQRLVLAAIGRMCRLVTPPARSPVFTGLTIKSAQPGWSEMELLLSVPLMASNKAFEDLPSALVGWPGIPDRRTPILA